MTTRAEPGTPLYLHLPFCAAKCHYCDFYSIAGEGQDADALIADLLIEIERRAPAAPRTVFLGGGTPSWFSETQLARLLEGLDRVTGFRSSAVEVTAECNPESLDESKARQLLDLGVNRLSIGLQALREPVLELFGRVHTADQGFEAFRAARRAGCRNLNVDLIFAWPGQTAAGWRDDLARVLDLGPEHLAAYDLAFEEGTPFREWLRTGQLEALPEDRELELFHITRELAAAAGLAAYEVSNFARPGRACRHNLNYWRNGPYVGIGPSAASRVGPRRFGSARSLGGWRKALAEDGAPDWSEELAPRGRLGETWWLGLRLAEGVDPARARSTAGWQEPSDPACDRARELASEGLLEEVGGRFRLSARGLPLADRIARELLALPEPETALRSEPHPRSEPLRREART